MSISDDAEKLNNCETCDQIKNIDNCSNYSSSDCDDLTSFSEETNLDSLRLNFNEGKLGASRSSARNVAASAVRQNKTFSAEQIREIERGNAMLVDKILYHNRRPNQYKSATNILPKVTSSEINRRRHQEKISRENEILLKKIQSVKPAVRYP